MFKELIGRKLGLYEKISTKISFYISRLSGLKALKEKAKRYILHLLSVIYDFEEEKEVIVSSFFNALIAFCSSSP